MESEDEEAPLDLRDDFNDSDLPIPDKLAEPTSDGNDDFPVQIRKRTVQHFSLADDDADEEDIAFIDKDGEDEVEVERAKRKLQRITKRMRRSESPMEPEIFVPNSDGDDSGGSDDGDSGNVYNGDEEEAAETDDDTAEDSVSQEQRFAELKAAKSFQPGQYTLAKDGDFYFLARIIQPIAVLNHYLIEFHPNTYHESENARMQELPESFLLRPSVFLKFETAVYIIKMPGIEKFHNIDNYVPGTIQSCLSGNQFLVTTDENGGHPAEDIQVSIWDLALDGDERLKKLNDPRDTFIGAEWISDSTDTDDSSCHSHGTNGTKSGFSCITISSDTLTNDGSNDSDSVVILNTPPTPPQSPMKSEVLGPPLKAAATPPARKSPILEAPAIPETPAVSVQANTYSLEVGAIVEHWSTDQLHPSPPSLFSDSEQLGQAAPFEETHHDNLQANGSAFDSVMDVDQPAAAEEEDQPVKTEVPPDAKSMKCESQQESTITVGDWVFAQWTDGKWYFAKVQGVMSPNHVSVKYNEDGITKDVWKSLLIKVEDVIRLDNEVSHGETRMVIKRVEYSSQGADFTVVDLVPVGRPNAHRLRRVVCQLYLDPDQAKRIEKSGNRKLSLISNRDDQNTDEGGFGQDSASGSSSGSGYIKTEGASGASSDSGSTARPPAPFTRNQSVFVKEGQWFLPASVIRVDEETQKCRVNLFVLHLRVSSTCADRPYTEMVSSHLVLTPGRAVKLLTDPVTQMTLQPDKFLNATVVTEDGSGFYTVKLDSGDDVRVPFFAIGLADPDFAIADLLASTACREGDLIFAKSGNGMYRFGVITACDSAGGTYDVSIFKGKIHKRKAAEIIRLTAVVKRTHPVWIVVHEKSEDEFGVIEDVRINTEPGADFARRYLVDIRTKPHPPYCQALREEVPVGHIAFEKDFVEELVKQAT